MLFNFTSVPPLALYVHLPWCVKRCGYCDFNAHQQAKKLPEMAYVDALLKDLESEMPYIWGRQIESVFIGGGTPSLFSAEAIDRLVSGLRALLNIHPSIEFTMEANPGTFEAQKFKEYRDLGINRLSIGIQSFDQQSLEKLGRIHGRSEAIKAVEIAHDAGFDNFNLDLMFALPGQSPEKALDDIQTAIDLEPTHISYYHLTLEPNTPFYKQAPANIPDMEQAWQIQQAGQARLDTAGFQQYEVSAYAKEGFRCKHNLNYWRFGDYVGIGAGAHGKITLPAEQRIMRRQRVKTPATFMQKAGSEQAFKSELIKARDVSFEFMLNTLRLKDGFESQLFSERTGRPISDAAAGLKEAERLELLEWDHAFIKPTAKGHDYLNEMTALFLPVVD